MNIVGRGSLSPFAGGMENMDLAPDLIARGPLGISHVRWQRYDSSAAPRLAQRRLFRSGFRPGTPKTCAGISISRESQMRGGARAAAFRRAQKAVNSRMNRSRRVPRPQGPTIFARTSQTGRYDASIAGGAESLLSGRTGHTSRNSPV